MYNQKPRNIKIAGVRTSVRLDNLSWKILHEIAKREGFSVHELCSLICKKEDGNELSTISSSIRLFMTLYYRSMYMEVSSKQNTYAPEPILKKYSQEFL